MGASDTPGTTDLPTLVGGIADDAKRLVGQQVDLIRAEIGETVRELGGGAAAVAAGGGLVAVGGLYAGHLLAHLAHRTARMPLWAGYGLVAGAAAAAGVALLVRGRAQLTGVRLLPHSAAALEENVEWLKDRLTPGGDR